MNIITDQRSASCRKTKTHKWIHNLCLTGCRKKDHISNSRPTSDPFHNTSHFWILEMLSHDNEYCTNKVKKGKINTVNWRLFLDVLTCDSDSAGGRLSMSPDATLVEAFIRLGNMADGHVTRRLSPDEGSVFIEIGWGVGGSGLYFTVQSDVVSLHHREDGTLQDHWLIWTWRQMYFCVKWLNLIEWIWGIIVT